MGACATRSRPANRGTDKRGGDCPRNPRRTARRRLSADLKAVQVRLSEDAYDALRMIADAGDQDLGEVARTILTEALLGKSHALKLVAARFARATTSGKVR